MQGAGQEGVERWEEDLELPRLPEKYEESSRIEKPAPVDPCLTPPACTLAGTPPAWRRRHVLLRRAGNSSPYPARRQEVLQI